MEKPAFDRREKPAQMETPALRRFRVGQKLKVRAADFGPAGHGVVSEHVPAPLFVPHLLPGEEAIVLVKHVSVHGGFAHAQVIRRLQCAPDRVVPECPHFGVCGGCRLLHLSYPAQLAHKTAVARHALGRSAQHVADCVSAPTEFHYRCRAKYVAAPHPEKGLVLGAYAPRSHHVLAVSNCKTNRPVLTAVAHTASQLGTQLGITPYLGQHDPAGLRYLLLREVQSGDVQVSLVFGAPPAHSLRTSLEKFTRGICARHPGVSSVVLHVNDSLQNAILPAQPASAEDRAQRSQWADGAEPFAASAGYPESGDGWAELGQIGKDELLWGQAVLWEQVGVSVRLSPRSFFQVNRQVAAQMYQAAAAWLARDTIDTVFDLYCGVSGLGLNVLSDHPKARLVGIEVCDSAVSDARASAMRAGFDAPQAVFLSGKVEEQLPAWSSATNGRAVALINPPRKGCERKALEALLVQAPERIIYMSCNPKTLARDLLWLAAHGYVVPEVRPYDMHPGTEHIECLAFLVRRDLFPLPLAAT